MSEKATVKGGFKAKLIAFFKNDIVKTVLVLTIIATVSGVLLGTVNNYTKVDKEKAFTDALVAFYPTSGTLNDIMEGDTIDNTSEQGAVEKAYLAGDGAYIMLVKGLGGFDKDGIEILIAIKDNVIEKIAKYSSSETPGLGSKATENDHLSQYIGVNIEFIDSFVWVKKGTDASAADVITAVSGASKSSNAVNNAVNLAINYYKNSGGQD